MKIVEFGGIQFTNKTAFEIQDMITEFQNGWKMTLIPTFKLASELYNETYEFRSDEAVSFNKFVCANSSLKPTPATFAQVIYIIANNFELDNFCNKFIDHFKNGIDVYSLTVADATLVNQFISLQLFSRYSTMLLHYISILECNTYSENASLSNYGLTQQQITWIEKQGDNYRKAISIIGFGVNKLFANIDKLPTTYVSTLNDQKRGFTPEDADSLVSTVTKIVKIGSAIAGGLFALRTISQAIYWRVSGGQALLIAKSIQSRKQLKTALELRLIHLRNLREGTASASVEKNIQITEDRLRKIEKEILDAEKRYGS